jgi:hypothetical protein
MSGPYAGILPQSCQNFFNAGGARAHCVRRVVQAEQVGGCAVQQVLCGPEGLGSGRLWGWVQCFLSCLRRLWLSLCWCSVGCGCCSGCLVGGCRCGVGCWVFGWGGYVGHVEEGSCLGSRYREKLPAAEATEGGLQLVGRGTGCN